MKYKLQFIVPINCKVICRIRGVICTADESAARDMLPLVA